MKIKLLAFGIAKDILSGQNLEIEIQDGTSANQLKAYLFEKYPAFQKLQSLMIAVNEEYVEEEVILEANDEIALIPPVSGG